jgi:hypothetical protein
LLVECCIPFFSDLLKIIFFRNGGSPSEALKSLINLIVDSVCGPLLNLLAKYSARCSSSLLTTSLHLLSLLLLKDGTMEILQNKKCRFDILMTSCLQRGLSINSPILLLQASVIATHLSIYPEYHSCMFKREFIAYLMGLLQSNTGKSDKGKGLDCSLVDSGSESLIFFEKLASSSATVIQLTSVILNNLCHESELAQILASLPPEYGITPLTQIYLIDKLKVSRLIQCLCLNTDFQAKILSSLPVEFTSTAKEKEELEATLEVKLSQTRNVLFSKDGLGQRSGLPGSRKDKKKVDQGEEATLKSPYEEMRELASDPVGSSYGRRT